MNARGRAVAAALILLLGPLLALGPLEAGAQETARASVQPDAPAAGPDQPAAARPAKERMAVYVLLAWVWISIAVLLWFVRLRVREADRVHRLGLGGTSKAPLGGREP